MQHKKFGGILQAPQNSLVNNSKKNSIMLKTTTIEANKQIFRKKSNSTNWLVFATFGDSEAQRHVDRHVRHP